MLRFCDTAGFRGVFAGEQDTNGRAPTKLAFRFDAAAVQLRDVLDDGKAKAGAAQLAAARLVDPIKSLEDARQIFFANADSSVANTECNLAVVAVRVQADFGAGPRIFHGIIEQVVEDFL